jgi:predicted MPP superfamily phosphohydrolase
MQPVQIVRRVGGALRSRLRALASLAAGGLLASAATAGYAFGVEPNWIELVPVSLRLPRLAGAFDGYRIVLFSDIHLGDGLDRTHLEQIVAHINRQRPDLVAIAGDFVSNQAPRHAPGLDALGALSAPDGVVAVLGNHDYGAGVATVRRVLAESGVRVLANTVQTLRRGRAPLHIAGVDDVMARRARLDLVLAELPADGAAILLVHEPDFADLSAATGRFDLQLSGHSHGGQVVLPFHGPLVLPHHARRYPSGRYQLGSMTHYTTRGVGTELLRVRFNCRPEITVLTLRAGADAPRGAAERPDRRRARRDVRARGQELRRALHSI